MNNTRLEGLKTIIQDKLKKINKSPKNKIPGNGPTRVYLVCDEEDQDYVKLLDDYLFSRHIEVMFPLFDGSAKDRRRLHKDNLSLCDAMMIYYNRANKDWLLFQLNDLRKAPMYRKTKPLKDSIIFITGEKTKYKEQFRTHEAKVIKKIPDFSCNDKELDSFITRIQH